MASLGFLPTNTDRAFPSHPSVDRYFAAQSIEGSRLRITSCIERGEGPALLIGAAGLGKSMLLELLATTFEDRLAVASITSTQLCTRRALLQAVLFGLGRPYREREEGDLRFALVEHLQDEVACPNGMLLLVDEAQVLPVRLLEELRILGNLARNGKPLARIVLAGSSSLEEQFASPAMEGFSQRLAARCYLAPMTYEETSQYVRAHVAAVGVDPAELFAEEALHAVYAASDGIPRLISQVCDRAIVMAVKSGESRIDAETIQNAWSDLHQLPAPWHSPAKQALADQSAAIEFGVLDAEPDETPVETLTAAPEIGIFETEAAASQEASETVAAQPKLANPLWNADEALSEVTLQPVVSAKKVTEAPQVAPAVDSDLFGGSFAEEELVIDRFAGLEPMLSKTTPAVVNQLDRSVSSLLQEADNRAAASEVAPPADEQVATAMEAETDVEANRFDAIPEITEHDVLPISVSMHEPTSDEPAAETLSPELETSVDESLGWEIDDRLEAQLSGIKLEADRDELEIEEVATVEVAEDEISEESSHATEIDQDGVLVIDFDEPELHDAPKPTVRRREYRQLFASLRG